MKRRYLEISCDERVLKNRKLGIDRQQFMAPERGRVNGFRETRSTVEQCIECWVQYQKIISRIVKNSGKSIRKNAKWAVFSNLIKQIKRLKLPELISFPH